MAKAPDFSYNDHNTNTREDALNIHLDMDTTSSQVHISTHNGNSNHPTDSQQGSCLSPTNPTANTSMSSSLLSDNRVILNNSNNNNDNSNSNNSNNNNNNNNSDINRVRRRELLNGLYELEAVIGIGSFGEVHCGRHAFSNTHIAIKIVDIGRFSHEHAVGFAKEVFLSNTLLLSPPFSSFLLLSPPFSSFLLLSPPFSSFLLCLIKIA